MMKKLVFLLLLVALFISCNADILMTNGEISKPVDKTGITDGEEDTAVFSKSAPTGVNATKSYYKDCISVRWDEVSGADYYTIEKCVKDTSSSPSSSDTWTTIGETIITNSYQDKSGLEVGKYYSYRVTAHTLTGETGDVSQVSTGTILSSPENIDATKGTKEDAIIVSWTQMPYVDQYEIYKSENSSITGLKSELVATVNADDENSVLYYSYEIDGAKEKGKELYFAVVAVGPTGSKADISFSRSGYTKVQGAPSRPSVNAGKGESKESISVHFKVDESDVTYIIKKSYRGSAEQVVFTSAYAAGETDPLSLLNSDSEGYIYQDDSVSPNVEYTYTVTASNSKGISEAGTSEGYLLSPLKALSLVPNRDEGHFGYDIIYTLPVGSDDAERTKSYTYVVRKTYKSGTVKEDRYTQDEFSTLFETFIPVDKNPTRDSENNEIRKIEITVSNGTEESESRSSNVIEDIPESVESITATRFAQPLNGESANSQGVYPVHVTWTTASTSSQIVTRKGSDGSVKTFKANRSLVDTDTSPLVVYDYYIDTSDELGRSIGEIKHAQNAYGAVIPEVLVAIFESAGLKPWEKQDYVPEEYKSYWKKSRISTLVNYGNASDLSTQMKALDSAEDTDHYRNGKITYSASMEGVGGQIYFTYLNFGENERFYINGSYEMHVNASGTGTCKSSSGESDGFDILGMYSGHISLSKMSVTNKAFSGSYVLTINYTDGSSTYEVAAK